MREEASRASWSQMRTALAACALVLAGGLAPAFGQPVAGTGVTPGADPVRAAQERVIRDAYRAHEEAISRSGKYVEIELSDFRTILPAEFGRVRYTELVDLPGSYKIQIQPSEVWGSDRELVGRSYRTLLRHVKLPSDPTHGLPLTIADLVAIGREHSGGAEPEPLALTSFQVTTKIEFETLSYRAAASWLRLPAGDDPGEYFVNDPVMNFLPEILTETDPIYPETELYRRAGEKEERLRAEIERQSQAPETACVADSEHYEYPVSWAYDDRNHATGNHASRAQASATCQCNSACTSQIMTDITETLCEDVGQPSGFMVSHNPRIRRHTENHLVVNGHLSGAKGSAGWGCFIQECLAWSACVASVNLAPGASPVSFAFSGSGLIADLSMSFGFECGTCSEAQPAPVPRLGRNAGSRGPFHLDPFPPPSGGGGYTGPSCRGTMTCSPSFLYGAACGQMPSPCFVEICDVLC